ncbi:EF-hand domain [Dillenia turbinata]|uniref:EF-hand domain n=1 Tax=Dillenia turbinata TaxID=194707 RepID=A0AAN8VC20_9MAGN
MAGQSQGTLNVDLFDAYFRRADLDHDGRISGTEAVTFFQGSNLPKHVLAQVWRYADPNGIGFLGRVEFYNALKLVTVAQSKRELTPDLVKKALYGPAAAKIPAPQINFVAPHAAQHNAFSVAPPQQSSVATAASQPVGPRGPLVLANASMNWQQFLPQQNQFMRTSQAMAPSTSSGSQPNAASQGMPGGGNMMGPPASNSYISTDWLAGRMGSSLSTLSSQAPSSQVKTPLDGFGLVTSGSTTMVQNELLSTTVPVSSNSTKSLDVALPSYKVETKDPKVAVVSGNGISSDSVFGDVFSVTSSQPTKDVLAPTFAAASASTSSALGSVRASSTDSLQGTYAQQPSSDQIQQTQSVLKQNQQIATQASTAFSSSGTVGAGNPISSQSPWPKMTQSDVQKYTKVFMEVDSDRDGKITGEQARDLFLSWKLPREILKQVWDLSDQDNDSMLSLKEFCIALYLMERYREGRPLPSVLPSGIIFDETVLVTGGQPQAGYGNAIWGTTQGFQQHQGRSTVQGASSGRPPRPVPIPQPDEVAQPSQQKSKIPVLEKHLVEELEKEILESKEKIEFYRTKMQELIMFKGKCDVRLNDVTERVAADKREVDALAKKYEEKYKQAANVAPRLTIEEATFRDIQEKKMVLYQAIVKMEQGDSADGDLQNCVNGIQSDLEELMKSLNDRCKKYGLHAKPTSLVELPFGWQPGVQEAVADWDEDWDNFEDEGFTFVKELTLEVQNVIAPPKPKSSPIQKEVSSEDVDSATVPSPNANVKSEKPPSPSERISVDEMASSQNENAPATSPTISPAGAAFESPSKEYQDSEFRKSDGTKGSPHANEDHSDQAGVESMLSGDKSFDEARWGAFDTHYDSDSVWGFNQSDSKGIDFDRQSEHSFFGADDFGLNPIRTGSPHTDAIPQNGSAFNLADSVPSTPMYNFSNSPTYSEAPEEQSFDHFARFDSFRTNDSGLFPPRDSLTRFDSPRSTRDSDFTLTRFDSVRGTRDSDFILTRFDSIRSTRDTEFNYGFPSFDDADPFGSSGLFKTLESRTPRSSDHWSSFN